jgi:hypothetical protein
MVVLLGVGRNGDDIINVDGKCNGTLRGGAMVHAPFARSTLETPLADGEVKRMVPDATGLFHAIDAFHEFHDPGLFAGCLEAGRLFHKHHFGLRKDTVKKSRFDVILLDVPIEGSSDVKESTEGFESCSGGCSFVVIDAVVLSIALCDITDFVSDDVSGVVMFAFAD